LRPTARCEMHSRVTKYFSASIFTLRKSWTVVACPLTAVQALRTCRNIGRHRVVLSSRTLFSEGKIFLCLSFFKFLDADILLCLQDRSTVLLSLHLRNQRLYFDFLSNGVRHTANVRDLRLTDGAWHTVIVTVTNRAAKFTLDCRTPVTR